MREQLIRAVLNTYGDAAFHVGIGVEPDCNFFTGLKCNSYAHYSRDQLLEAIQLSPLLSFPPMPDTLDKLVINEKLYLYKPSVNDAQVYTAPENADKYVHCVCRYNPHYDIICSPITESQRPISINCCTANSTRKSQRD